MAGPVPVTAANELVEELNRRLLVEPRYASPDDLNFRRFLARAKSIVQVEPGLGHNVLGLLYGYAGDKVKALHHLDLALKLDAKHAVIFYGNQASTLVNLGYFSEAQEPFRRGSTPEEGFFTAKWTAGMSCGAFHALASFVERARLLKLDLAKVPVELIERAVRLMNELSISDADLAIALDVAGDLLRKNRLFFIGETPEVFVWDEDELEKTLSFTYKVGLASSEALALDRELGRALIERDVKVPFEVMIHFEPANAVDEHHPERPAIAG